MPDAGRKLSSVGALPAISGKRIAGGAPPAGRERWVLAILGGLLLLCAIGLATEWIRNARLEARVAELSGELDATRATLGAYEARLDEVRGAVARLHALVQGDPAAPEPQP